MRTPAHSAGALGLLDPQLAHEEGEEGQDEGEKPVKTAKTIATVTSWFRRAVARRSREQPDPADGNVSSDP